MEEKYMAEDGNATEKLYYQDSHLSEFNARVLSCEKTKKGYEVVLDRTAFFPEGGGQFGDIGWINDIEVIDTREKNGVIIHICKEELAAESSVSGKLDFVERFSRMQQHTGEHIISGIVHKLFGYENVGFHLGNEVTTLDFNGSFTDEQVLEVENRANQAVFANVPVEILYPDKETLRQMEYRSKIEIEGQVRLVRIPGVDTCACCAPHTRTTGEVGLIKIISSDRHRGGTRMTMVSGARALRDYQQKLKSVSEVSVALSSKPEKIGEAVLHMKEQQTRMREQLNELQAAHLQEKLSSVSPEDHYVCLFEKEMDNVAVRNFVNDAMEICGGICAAFVGSDETGYRYILGSKNWNMREVSSVLNSHFQGKGGGKPEMVQGSLTGKKAEIEQLLATYNH